MTLGQKAAMANLAFGYHLNADSNDFAAGLIQNGVDTNITYDAANGILGPAASFNGTSSKIYLGSGDLNTPIQNDSFTVVCLFRTVAGWSSFPILARGLVSYSSKYYGIYIGIYPTTFMMYRNVGDSSSHSNSIAYAFQNNATYLLGVAFDISTGYSVFWIQPLKPNGKSVVYYGDWMPVYVVSYYAPYDQGYHFGANLRNVSNVYGKGILGEVLIFDTVKTTKWFMMYAAQLRGLLD